MPLLYARDGMDSPSPERVARQHLQHGQARRDSRRYYMRHRSSIKRRSKSRYRRVRHSGTFRRIQRHRRLHPNMHHRIRAASTGLDIPLWLLTQGDVVVTGVCCDDILFVAMEAPEDVQAMDYRQFLAEAVFLEESDIDLLFQALDVEMGLDPSVQSLDEDWVEDGEIE